MDFSAFFEVYLEVDGGRWMRGTTSRGLVECSWRAGAMRRMSRSRRRSARAKLVKFSVVTEESHVKSDTNAE